MADWHYDNGGQAVGPVGDSELQALVAAGRIGAATLLWTDGMDGWKPARDLGIVPVAASPAVHGWCSECSRALAPQESIRLGEVTVCPGCRDIVLQRMMAGGPIGRASAFRWGRRLVFFPTADLGDSCLKCGGPAQGERLTKKLYWHNPALYLLILFPGLLIYAIVAMIVQKRVTVSMPLCAMHRTQRRNRTIVAWGAFLAGIGCFFAAGATSSMVGTFVLLGLGLVIASLVLAMMVSNSPLRPVHISDQRVEATGASPVYLGTLPEWQGR